MDLKQDTAFAPAEKTSDENLKSDIARFADNSFMDGLLSVVPDVFLILNKQRQIVYANATLKSLLELENKASVYGQRPGEAFNCIHARKSPGGCGTTEFCRYCGAVKAILNSHKGELDVQECRITQDPGGNSLDFRVWAMPIYVKNDLYTVFVTKDICDEKRRRSLERIFFHDILNTAGGIQGIAPILREASSEQLDELLVLVESASGTLVEEIHAQKDLLAAEGNELQLQIADVNSLSLLQSVVDIYSNHDVGIEKNIIIATESSSVYFKSDERLLKRVLSNMLKNALEASSLGMTITLGCLESDGKIEFWVNNSLHMPKEAQMQVFQRSFSTKGQGRGLGTYSIKMLSERYLGGSVSFSTSEEEGTTFRVRYPLDHSTQK